MNRDGWSRMVGVFLVLALLWVMGDALGLALNPFPSLQGSAQASSHKVLENPCNPDSSKDNNPCNPCAASQTANPCAASQTANPCNPCNPCAASQTANPCNPCAASQTANPCNPCAASQTANPCNPCAASQTANPCNPCAASQTANPCNPCNPCAASQTANPCNPCAASQTANPCNPCAASQTANPCNPCNPCAVKRISNPCNPCGTAGASTAGLSPVPDEVLEWAKSYRKWGAVSGFVLSPSHGNRIVQTFITPPEAAAIYKGNATLRRERRAGFRTYPEGTSIVQRSWLRNKVGGPGEAGPLFFMRKEAPGYDQGGGNWRYGMARGDFTVIGQDFSKEMAFCKDCHLQVKRRDFLYSIDR